MIICKILFVILYALLCRSFGPMHQGEVFVSALLELELERRVLLRIAV